MIKLKYLGLVLVLTFGVKVFSQGPPCEEMSFVYYVQHKKYEKALSEIDHIDSIRNNGDSGDERLSSPEIYWYKFQIYNLQNEADDSLVFNNFILSLSSCFVNGTTDNLMMNLNHEKAKIKRRYKCLFKELMTYNIGMFNENYGFQLSLDNIELISKIKESKYGMKLGEELNMKLDSQFRYLCTGKKIRSIRLK